MIKDLDSDLRVFACYSADTSGLRDYGEPISMAITRIACDGNWAMAVLGTYDGVQEPVNPISHEAAGVHGLHDADVAGKHFDLITIDAMFAGVDKVFSWSPGFDNAMYGRCRLNAEPPSWHKMRLLRTHKEPPAAGHDGVSRARARVDHMVECLGAQYTRNGALLPWIDEVLAQPPTDVFVPPNYSLEGNAKFDGIHHRNLSVSRVEDRFTLWTKSDINYIVAYNRSGPNGGPGSIFTLLKSHNRVLAKHMTTGGWAEGTITETEGLSVKVKLTY